MAHEIVGRKTLAILNSLEREGKMEEKLNLLIDKEARIKELEKRIKLAEVTRDDALAYAKGYRVRAEELEMRIKELGDELKEGDYWMQRVKKFLDNGNCPICFATDEEGHKDKCFWGQAETKNKELEKAIKEVLIRHFTIWITKSKSVSHWPRIVIWKLSKKPNVGTEKSWTLKF